MVSPPGSVTATGTARLEIAVLVKQVPKFDSMGLGPDGRLQRDGVEAELNPYCRRAVAAGVQLSRLSGGRCRVFTLGPPSAGEVLREAIAWGADEGVLMSDPTFAGSDTLATSLALAAALRRFGPFDLVLVGRSSVDADTGQVGPQVAELLDLPFVGAARSLAVGEGRMRALLEHDDGWSEVDVGLAAVTACAERLCEPCKVDVDGRVDVDRRRVTTVSARDLGPGPWGRDASPTRVGEVRSFVVPRAKHVLSGPAETQVDAAVEALLSRWSPSSASPAMPTITVPSAPQDPQAGTIGVIVEHDHRGSVRALLGKAAELGAAAGRRVTAIVPAMASDLDRLGGWGADRVVFAEEADSAEDVAAAVARWCADERPWAVLALATTWGREVMSRLAVRLGAGLTGDAVDLEPLDGRLVGWKPAFGGQLVAAIRSTSEIQLATVRPGSLDELLPRAGTPVAIGSVIGPRRARVNVLVCGRDDDLGILAQARNVVGVGAGVPPERYAELDGLATVLRAPLAATRKVTDGHHLPRARQVGITGTSIRPVLYVAIGISGRFNHMVGVRAAGTILAINRDAGAPIFDACDIGLVGDWSELVPPLTLALERLSRPHAKWEQASLGDS
jgi:electron transfer flavoprotein alpha subunit